MLLRLVKIFIDLINLCYSKDMITFFHRNLKAGYSINKVTQTIVSSIYEKEEYFMPHAGASIYDLLCNLFFTYKHRNKSGINHVTGDVHYVIISLIGCKTVLTIHDTVLLDYHHFPLLKRVIVEWLWFRIPLKFATKVVCISEQTRKSVQKYTRRKDIEVIHNAVDPSFKRYKKDDFHNQILFIGTNPNKNLERSFEALKGLQCHISIIGKLSPSQIDSLRVNKISYENKVGLSDSELIEEYKRTDLISFISLFEGFGMPIVEANAIGRPVITSNIPVLNEVANNSAVFVNPYDINDIRDGYKEILTNKALREEIVKKGLINAERFNAKRIVKEWKRLYEAI